MSHDTTITVHGCPCFPTARYGPHSAVLHADVFSGNKIFRACTEHHHHYIDNGWKPIGTIREDSSICATDNQPTHDNFG